MVDCLQLEAETQWQASSDNAISSQGGLRLEVDCLQLLSAVGGRLSAVRGRLSAASGDKRGKHVVQRMRSHREVVRSLR